MTAINHPEYYASGDSEAINVISIFELNVNLGRVIKYILRAGQKENENPLDTLQKAQWYLNHEIERLSFLQDLPVVSTKE